MVRGGIAMLRKKILIALMLSMLMCIEAYGQETNYIASWRYNEANEVEYYMKEIVFVSKFTKQEKLMLIFDNFFNRCDNNEISFVPKGTKLKNVKLYDGHLDVDVSEHIKAYGGGTAWEQALMEGLLLTAFVIDDVTDVTLYIEGQVEYLPEGTMLSKYRKEDYIWTESAEERIIN
jgi:spore germination protein GerM